MIFGIGTDICEIDRLGKWVENEKILTRYFNPKEILTEGSVSKKCQHYAARFAAKEAFSKALGTGFRDFSLKDLYIQNDKLGKPFFVLENSAKEVLEKIVGSCLIHVSLSHEKNNAVAFVIIEKVD